MNHSFRLFAKKGLLMVGVVLQLLAVRAGAIPFQPDEVMVQQITKSLNTASLDDYLLDLARTGRVNIIVDVTEFAAQEPVKAYPSTPGAIAGQTGKSKEHWGTQMLNLLGDVIVQKQLSMLRVDQDTVLFWSKPDLHELFGLQLAALDAEVEARFAELAGAKTEGQRAGLPEETIHSELSDEERRWILSEYLKNQHGWKGTAGERTENVNIRTRFDDLSPALRALIFQDLRAETIPPIGLYMLRDEFWKNCHIKLSKPLNGQVVSELEIPAVLFDAEGNISTRSSYTLSATEDRVDTTTTEKEMASIEALIPLVKQPHPIHEPTKYRLSQSYRGVSPDISDAVLNDPALQKVITLSAKHLPLGEVLEQLQKQSGIELTLGDSAPAKILVTAGIEKMPLAKCMEVLSRLYGATWIKTEGITKEGHTYKMQRNERGALNLKLLQMGDIDVYHSFYEMFERPRRAQSKAALIHAIVQQVGLEALNRKDGVAVSSMTPALQQQLRHVLEERRFEFSNRKLFTLNQMLGNPTQGLVLRFGGSSKSPYAGLFGETDRLRFTVEDGASIVPVFRDFSMETASAEKERKRLEQEQRREWERKQPVIPRGTPVVFRVSRQMLIGKT